MATRRRTSSKKKTSRKKATSTVAKPVEAGIDKKANRKPGVKPGSIRGPGTGQPPFKPTQYMRDQVELMVGMGMTYKEMAVLTLNPTTMKGISLTTLQEHFEDELQTGGPKVKRQIVAALVKKATSDTHPNAVTAAIFLCKTRYGFRETQVHEHTVNSGVLVAPATMTPQQWIEEQDIKNAKRISPVEVVKGVVKSNRSNGTNGTNGNG